jgi:hypothetical protein
MNYDFNPSDSFENGRRVCQVALNLFDIQQGQCIVVSSAESANGQTEVKQPVHDGTAQETAAAGYQYGSVDVSKGCKVVFRGHSDTSLNGAGPTWRCAQAESFSRKIFEL